MAKIGPSDEGKYDPFNAISQSLSALASPPGSKTISKPTSEGDVVPGNPAPGSMKTSKPANEGEAAIGSSGGSGGVRTSMAGGSVSEGGGSMENATPESTSGSAANPETSGGERDRYDAGAGRAEQMGNSAEPQGGQGSMRRVEAMGASMNAGMTELSIPQNVGRNEGEGMVVGSGVDVGGSYEYQTERPWKSLGQNVEKEVRPRDVVVEGAMGQGGAGGAMQPRQSRMSRGLQGGDEVASMRGTSNVRRQKVVSATSMGTVKRFKTTRMEASQLDQAILKLSSKLGVTIDFSKMTRALWSVYLQHEEDILRNIPEGESWQRPANNDPIGMAEFDQNLSDLVNEGFMVASRRPR